MEKMLDKEACACNPRAHQPTGDPQTNKQGGSTKGDQCVTCTHARVCTHAHMHGFTVIFGLLFDKKHSLLFSLTPPIQELRAVPGDSDADGDSAFPLFPSAAMNTTVLSH